MIKNVFLIFTVLLLSSQMVAAKTLNLDEFIDLVNQHSKDLALAEKEQEMAAANKKAAISTALPKIGAEANYKRNLTEYYMYADFGDFGAMLGMPSTGEPAKFKVNRNNEYSANVALQQTLFSPAVGSAIKAANQYQKLTDYIFKASQQAIVSAGKKMFYQTLLMEKFWQVTKAAEENAKDNYDVMKLKFDNGVISEFQLLQSEVRWKNAIPQTAETKRNLELMLNNLKNWTGIPVVESLSLEGEFDDYPQIPSTLEIESILEKRPDFNALLWEEKLRGTNVGAKKSAYFPTLTGTAAYAFSAQSDEFQLDQQNGLYMVGLNLLVPIFTGGYRKSEVQKAQIELDKTRIKIDQTKDNIYNEISNVYLRLKEAHQRIYSAEATLKVAQKAFNIAENTAKNGLTTQLELKDARIGFDQAKMNHYAAIFDYLAAYYDWEQSIGAVES